MPLASDREQLRYFEDFEVGMTSEFGPRAITEAEIIDFAAQWDPQPFHLDGEAARASMYGGLIASGWHTGAMMMQLLTAHFVPRPGNLASPGLDELRWLRPVRPGDSLRVRLTVLEVRPSRSKPDRGLVRSRAEILDAEGSVVMTLVALNMMLRRPTRPADPPSGAP